MSDAPITEWLDDLALYFETHDTNGEDRAHWANVYNAEIARKVKAALTAYQARVKELEADNARLSSVLGNIELLRADDGNAVIICCDDPEAASRDLLTAIDVTAQWTRWIERRFHGSSVADCLAKAAAARAAYGETDA